MKRDLVWSKSFSRAAKRITKKDPFSAETIKIITGLLAQDPYDPHLKTHKLKGPFKGYLACSAGYDLRIVFRIVIIEGTEAILLETIGTHDEVY